MLNQDYPKCLVVVKIKIWTEQEKNYLKEIASGRSHKEISEMMIKKFQDEYFTVDKTKGALNRYKINTGRTGFFQKGQVSWNKGKKGKRYSKKTEFKKGNIPPNQVDVGTEVTDTDGYHKIKTANPRTWEYKHKILWEKHHGKIPPGFAVIFLDGNKNNIVIENLEMVSRAELLTINRKKLISDNREVSRSGVIVGKLITKANELSR